jgi:hypothetical protein
MFCVDEVLGDSEYEVRCANTITCYLDRWNGRWDWEIEATGPNSLTRRPIASAR